MGASVRVRLTFAVACLLAVAACTGEPGGERSDQQPSASASPSVYAPSASQVVAELARRGAPLRTPHDYTAATDPNKLLGKPNGYLSKTAFSDSRVPAEYVRAERKEALIRGGSVEVFVSADRARARAEDVKRISRSLPKLAEHDLLAGPVLLRLSRLLTLEQIAVYQSALAEAVGQPVVMVSPKPIGS